MIVAGSAYVHKCVLDGALDYGPRGTQGSWRECSAQSEGLFEATAAAVRKDDTWFGPDALDLVFKAR